MATSMSPGMASGSGPKAPASQARRNCSPDIPRSVRSRRTGQGRGRKSVDVLFIAGVAVVAADSVRSRELYADALGLPLAAEAGSEYFHSERIGGAKHFGIWPLAQAARACFGQ